MCTEVIKPKEELQDIEDMLNETSDKEEVEMLKEESSALKQNYLIWKKN